MRSGILLAILFLTAGSAESLAAADRSRFDLNTGIGFAVDSSRNVTFSFGAGANYHFTEYLAAGPFFDLFAGNGITTFLDRQDTESEGCTLVPCSSTRYNKITLDTGGQLVFTASAPNGLELSASAGAGYIRSLGLRDGLTFPIGLGAYLTFQDDSGNRVGIGTVMTLHLTTLDHTRVIWNWRVISLEIRF